MENEINITESLHTKVIQRSQYVKIDDNLLNFDFDQFLGFKKNRVTDEYIMKMKEELNRVHLKFVSQD